jgi:hypothetical protein
MNENLKFTEAQIKSLQEQCGRIEKVNPDSQTLKTLREFVGKLPRIQRTQLAGAGIKWVSYFAKQTLPKEPSLVPGCGGTETPVTVNGRKYLWCWDRNCTGTFPGDHVYVDLETDLPISNEDYEALFSNH